MRHVESPMRLPASVWRVRRARVLGGAVLGVLGVLAGIAMATPGPASANDRGKGRRLPAAATANRCPLRVDIEPRLLGADVRLKFVLVTTERTPQTVTLRGGCGGFVSLRGLPEGVGPGRVTDCMDDQPVKTLTVRPRQRLLIEQVTVRGTGDDGKPALPTGSVFLQAEAEADRLVCSSAPLHLVRSARGTLRRARGEPAVPPTPSTPPPRPPVPVRPASCSPCAIGCPNSVPLTGTGPDGCPRCGCAPSPMERLLERRLP